MKILYITPFQPSLRSGGGRHCYANARALSLYPSAIVDYIGPKFEVDLPELPFGVFRKNLTRNFTLIDKIKAALSKESTSLVSLYNDFLKRNTLIDYDLLFVETTRCGFVFKHSATIEKTICSVHNVEADYLNFNKSGGTRLTAKNIKKSERKTLSACNLFLVMHSADEQRLKEIYNINQGRVNFLKHPVCSLPPSQKPTPFSTRNKDLVFIGSLDSKFNENGLRTFLQLCWPSLKDTGYSLVVAGRRPSKNLINFIRSKSNVTLFANPRDMAPILRNASILLLPDMTGTGMKLRVAEAMSLGVPVVGTEVGLRGYEKIDYFGRSVKSISEMSNIILELLQEPSRLTTYSEAAIDIWKKQYSIDTFTHRLHGILDDFFNEKNK